jgi:hypothetical protein
MKIPEKLQIAGRTFKVIFDNKPLLKPNLSGQIQYNQCKIILRKSDEYGIYARDQQEQIFLHEIVHGILNAMDHQANDDEGFVESFSQYLHQIIKQL